jgi:uncharacterized cupredoxin-like copper-binding protein
MRTTSRVATLAAAAALALSSCGGGGGTVDITLQEFSVLPAQDSAPAGEVTFEATNDGPDDNHELVVIRTDLAAEELPTAEDGSVDEAGEGIEVIGEIEEFPPGETQSATFDLEAGNYVLICNVVEEHEGEIEAHYSLGMRTGFTVE